MLRHIVFTLALLLLSLSGMSPLAHAQAVSLEQCQDIQNRIERYNTLRRRGGGANEMAQWKQQRRESEAEFRQLRCREYGRELRG